MSYEPYDPLSDRNLEASVAEALLERDVTRLDLLKPFKGGGLYAIYYTGPFAAYEANSSRNVDGKFEWPIYVGMAGDSSTRTGAEKTDRRLYGRVNEHRNSINQAINIDVKDFYCRVLVVKDIWIPLGESLLIAKFSPVWNRFLEGFGNHNPGSGRHKGMVSKWDTLHPGRPWAPNFQPRPETAEQILEEVKSYLAGTAVPAKMRLLAL